MLAHADAAAVAGAARQARGQARHRRRRGAAAHAVGRQGARQADRDRAVLLGAAGQRQRPAEEAGAHAVQVETVFVELDLAERRLQRRQIGDQVDVVVLQLQGALHLRLVQIGQRHLEFQAEAGVAAAARVFGEMADPAQHRAGRHVAEEALQRSAGAAVDVEDGIVGAEIRQHGAHVAQVEAEAAQGIAADFHAVAVEHDAAVDGLRQRPGRLVVRRAVAGRVFEHGAGQAPGHAEFAARAFGRVRGAERELRQVAAQAQAHVFQHAALQGGGQPLAQVFRRGVRQEAADLGDAEAIQAAADVGYAGAMAWPQRQLVAPGQVAAQAALGEGQLVDLDQQLLLRLVAPARLQGQAVERHGRFREPGRHAQRQVAGVDADAAAILGGVDAAAQVIDARQGRPGRRRGAGRARRLRLQTEAGHLPLDAVAGQARIGAVPGRGKIGQLAARREVGQQLALQRRQRQLRRQLGQGRQVDLGCLHRHALRLAGARRGVGFADGTRRQHAAVGQGDREMFDGHRVAIGAEGRLAFLRVRQQFLVRRQAARHARQVQGRQLRPHARGHAGQGQVGGEAGQARAVEADPGAQRALALG